MARTGDLRTTGLVEALGQPVDPSPQRSGGQRVYRSLAMLDSPTQPGLAEFTRPISRQKWLVMAMVLLAVGASIAYSLNQKPVYQSSASIGVQDLTRDLGVVGIPLASNQTAAQVAASAARVVVQSTVLSRVKKDLGTRLSGAQLIDRVHTTVDASSNLVEIKTEGDSAKEAQGLANAFARAAAQTFNEKVREDYSTQAADLRRQRPRAPKTPTQNSTEERSLYNAQISRLSALSAIAAPAKVVDTARRPSLPSSPRPVRNAFFGGFLGVVVALSLVFVRDSFDRRLHSANEIETESGLTVVGHVREGALGRYPDPRQKMTLDPVDWEQFRIIRRNLDFIVQGGPPRTIAVTSALPEEGKSTVALYVALASAAASRRTLLVECDLRRPVLARRLGLSEGPGLTDFVAGTAEPAEILQSVAVDTTVSSKDGRGAASTHEFVCITAGSPTQQPAEVLSSKPFRAMLEQVSEAYDVVILDTTPMLPVVDALEVLPQVAAVLVCVRAARTTRDQVRAGRAALERLPDRPIGLVVTGTRRVDDDAYGYYGYGQ